MEKDNKILFIFLLLGLFSFAYKIYLIHSLPIQTDELYSLARACNHSIYPSAISPSIDPNKIYQLNDILEVFSPKSANPNFFRDSIYYIKNFYKLSNHPPVSDVLSKLAVINNQVGIINLRYLALIYWLLSLPLIYLTYKEFKVKTKIILTTLAIYSGLMLTSLVASFPKAYSLQILACWLALFVYLKSSSVKNNWTKHFTIICSLHLAFLVHYFSVLILLPWYLLVDFSQKGLLKIRSLLYSLTLIIYLPIIQIQATHTSKYFSGHIGLISELKSLFKIFINFYALNFYKTNAYLIILLLGYLAIKSKQKNDLGYFFLFSMSAPLALLVYDLCSNSHMLNTLRYTLPSLPFVALVLAILIYNKLLPSLIITILLLLNMILPSLANKTLLNEGLITGYQSYLQTIKDKDFLEPTLLLVPNYSAQTLIVLKGIQAKLLNQLPILAVNQEPSEKQALMNNIYIANASKLNNKQLKELLMDKEITKINIFDKPKNYQNLDLTNYPHQTIGIRY